MANEPQATFTIPAGLAAPVEAVLRGQGNAVDPAPEAPSFGIGDLVMVVSAISGLASFIKACLDIRKLLEERRNAQKVSVKPPHGPAIVIAADSDDADLERRLSDAFARQPA